jgi:hypothetical protein
VNLIYEPHSTVVEKYPNIANANHYFTAVKSATEKTTIVQKMVLMTYRPSNKTPLTGPGKKLSISYL